MDIFIGIVIIFIPLYLSYNSKCLHKRKLSIWIKKLDIEVDDNRYYIYQYKLNLINALILSLTSIICSLYKLDSIALIMIVMAFILMNIISRKLALRKGYLKKVNNK